MWKLLLISFLAFQIGCAKKNSAGKIRQAAQDNTKQAQQTGQELALKAESDAKAGVKVEAKVEVKAEEKLQEKPAERESTIASSAVAKPQTVTLRAENPLVLQAPAVPANQPEPSKPEASKPETDQSKPEASKPETQPKVATSTINPAVTPAAKSVKVEEVAVATDSEAIKTQAGFKIAFKNLEAVRKLSENKKLIIMRQKELELTSPQALLGKLNEEHYCQIQLDGKFHPQDFLLLDLESTKFEQTDKDLDLYRTQMQFKNSNGAITIACDHTTNNFYIEEMYLNLGQLIVVYGLDNQILNAKNFVNPRTERRKINAIKLKDVEKLNQIILSADSKEGLGIASGVVDSSDKLINFVAAGEKKATCVITEKLGEFKTDRVYVRVDKGILVDTPKDIPSATLYSTYRADGEHAFELSCFMRKDAEWNVLFEAMKGVFEFGVLDRPVYNKSFDEIKALHTKK